MLVNDIVNEEFETVSSHTYARAKTPSPTIDFVTGPTAGAATTGYM